MMLTCSSNSLFSLNLYFKLITLTGFFKFLHTVSVMSPQNVSKEIDIWEMVWEMDEEPNVDSPKII